MSLTDDLQVLRNVPLFANLDPAKLKLLAFTSEHMIYESGDTLFCQGDAGDAAYIILDGKAEVIVETDDGPLTVAQLGRYEILGEIAILCDVPRTATVKASAGLTTLRIAKDNFLNLIKQFPNLSIQVMNEIAGRLHHTTQQVTQLTNRVHALERHAGAAQPSDHGDNTA